MTFLVKKGEFSNSNMDTLAVLSIWTYAKYV